MAKDERTLNLIREVAQAFATYHDEHCGFACLWQAVNVLINGGPLKGYDPQDLMSALMKVTVYKPAARLQLVSVTLCDNEAPCQKTTTS